MSSLAERFAAVQASLPPTVTLVAVSKTRSVAEIQALYDLGQRDFGENYPQELRNKAPELPQDIRWHFIGHLQRSNVKHVLPLAHLVHGIDSAKLLDEVEKRAGGKSVEVLLQIHIAQENTKHGLDAQEAETVLQAHQRWPHVVFRGLMGMATFTEDTAVVSQEFRGLAGLFERLKALAPTPEDFDTLSMGMSGDAPLAIASGSTLVRVGTAIFGTRIYP